MKVLHTADWHLGHRLHEQSQKEEQQLFLDWITNHIIEEKYDVLLISGDIFDTGMPSSQSLNQYYNFLIGLNNTCCKHIVITGGNHDSPGTLNAPKELLNALSIKVVGKATELISEEVFKLKVKEDEVVVAAVPYLRDQDVRKAIAGEIFEDINERYKTALVAHYKNIDAYCLATYKNTLPVIAMGHLFAVGGSISDSEKDISVGNLGHIGAEDFPENFDYVALGHLHKPQWVGGKEHIRYSGSPVVLSFSEISYPKKIISLTIKDRQVASIDEIEIPQFRNILKISGSLIECTSKLEKLNKSSYHLETWVEVVLNDESSILESLEIKKRAEVFDIKVLKVSLKNKKEILGIDALMENVKQIKNLKPEEVFLKKCEDEGIDLDENKDLWNAFNEALLIAQEQKD